MASGQRFSTSFISVGHFPWWMFAAHQRDQHPGSVVLSLGDRSDYTALPLLLLVIMMALQARQPKAPQGEKRQTLA